MTTAYELNHITELGQMSSMPSRLCPDMTSVGFVGTEPSRPFNVAYFDNGEMIIDDVEGCTHHYFDSDCDAEFKPLYDYMKAAHNMLVALGQQYLNSRCNMRLFFYVVSGKQRRFWVGCGYKCTTAVVGLSLNQYGIVSTIITQSAYNIIKD